jgi:hypothetical protein
VKKLMKKVKIKSTYIVTVLLIISFPECLKAQRNLVPNLPKYDTHTMHFGFLLGLNVTDFTIKRKGDFLQNDTVYTVESTKQTGFNLGIVSNLRLAENFDLRFIPDLSFAQRNLDYFLIRKGVLPEKVTKKVESTFLEFPLELKFKSNRIMNYRIYVLAGGKYGIDMVSQAKVENKDKEFVKLKRNDYGYTIGAGIDCYMELFKLSIELKMYQGLNNLLVKDANPSVYTQSLDKLNSKIFLINFTFE